MVNNHLWAATCRFRPALTLAGTLLANLPLALLTGGCASSKPRAILVRPGVPSEDLPVASPAHANLRLVTFNVWGLPRWMNGASADRFPRIARQLERLQPDLILLQEVWTKKALRSAPLGPQWFIARSAGQVNFFQENGLLTCSRHPIIGGEFHKFRDAALPDSFVKKGALKVTIELPGNRLVNVWNVHLQAGNAEATRSLQTAQLIAWVRAARDGQFADIVAGDFNCTPDSPQYRCLFEQIGPTAQAISGAACFTTYDGLSANPSAAQTLDHAFIRLQPSVSGVKTIARPVFTTPRPDQRLSDHLGLEIALDFALAPVFRAPIETVTSRPLQADLPLTAADR